MGPTVSCVWYKVGWWSLCLFGLDVFLFMWVCTPYIPESQIPVLRFVFLPCEHQNKDNRVYWSIHRYLWMHLSYLSPHRPHNQFLKDVTMRMPASAESWVFPKLPDAQRQLRPNASILLTRAHQCEVLLTICVEQCAADGKRQAYAYCGCPFPAASVEPNFLC